MRKPGVSDQAMFKPTCSDSPENWLVANNKGTDQAVQMHRLVCACVVHKPQRQVFLRQGLNEILETCFRGFATNKGHRPTCASVQSDQCLCYWLIGHYHM